MATVWLINSIVLGPKITLMLCAKMLSPRRLHMASTVLILQVPFFISKYLFLNIQVLLLTRQKAMHGTVVFTSDFLMPHTAFPSYPAMYQYSETFVPSSSTPVQTQSLPRPSTQYRLNGRKLNTYWETCPPSWVNGTWQVPSKLPHSLHGISMLMEGYTNMYTLLLLLAN